MKVALIFTKATNANPVDKTPFIRNGKQHKAVWAIIMIKIKSLYCSNSSCFHEFEGLTDKGNNILIYYRLSSGLFVIQLGDVIIVREYFPSPKDKYEDATLEELQERVIFYGISFPENCTLSGLRDDLINDVDWSLIFQ